MAGQAILGEIVLLRDYSAAAPRPGLETRILARVRAQADRRRQGWTLAFAAAAAAMLLVVIESRPRTPNPLSSHESGKVLAVLPRQPVYQERALSPLPKGNAQSAATPGSKDFSNRPQLLEVVEAIHRESRLVFEQEQSYLSPEEAAVSDLETAAPSISIQDLGVQPITIKELTTEKEIDEKGQL